MSMDVSKEAKLIVQDADVDMVVMLTFKVDTESCPLTGRKGTVLAAYSAANSKPRAAMARALARNITAWIERGCANTEREIRGRN